MVIAKQPKIIKGTALMYRTHHAGRVQQKRLHHHAANNDAYSFFNLLTSPELLDTVESLLPEHRERLFPPTETLSMFLAQAMSADRSCQNAVNDAAIKRLLGRLPLCILALARSACAPGGWNNGEPAGYSCQPIDLSPTE